MQISRREDASPSESFCQPAFWSFYDRLPARARKTADKYFALLKDDPKHPSLHLKKIGEVWSARAGLHYRAIGLDAPSENKGILWIWVGSHAEYDRLINKK